MYEYQVLCKCVRLSFSLCVYVLLDPLADFVYLKDIWSVHLEARVFLRCNITCLNGGGSPYDGVHLPTTLSENFIWCEFTRMAFDLIKDDDGVLSILSLLVVWSGISTREIL